MIVDTDSEIFALHEKWELVGFVWSIICACGLILAPHLAPRNILVVGFILGVWGYGMFWIGRGFECQRKKLAKDIERRLLEHEMEKKRRNE